MRDEHVIAVTLSPVLTQGKVIASLEVSNKKPLMGLNFVLG